MTALLETRNLNKSFFGIAAVKDVSVRVGAGEILGLIGQNGAGKSTLMNLVGGVVQPDSGEMIYQGQPYAPRSPADANAARIAFIPQQLNLFTNLTIAENIFIEGFPTRGRGPFQFIDRATVRHSTREVLDAVGLDLSPDMQIDRLSPGERQLVEIAKALYLDAALIILDEPTTSLTTRETDELVTQEPAASFDVSRMISLMVGRSIEQLYPARTSKPGRDVLLELRGISAAGIVENVNLALRQGEVLGVFGLMGSGRTELARMIFGLDTFEKGEVVVNGTPLVRTTARRSISSRMAFVTENRREEGLLMNINIADNIALVSLPQFARVLSLINQGEMVDSATSAANALQLKSGNIVIQPAKSLSGGNQQKVVIAKWLLSQPTIFIMDEPTRGIDVGAKYEIYSIIDQLAASGSGVLFISSELEELMGMCDRIVVMSRGEIFGEFTREQFNEKDILQAAFREGEGVLA
jgi:ABC-type sugar transport system ATPase subunit